MIAAFDSSSISIPQRPSLELKQRNMDYADSHPSHSLEFLDWIELSSGFVVRHLLLDGRWNLFLL